VSLPSRPASLILLLAIAAIIWFAPLGERRLFHPDEGRYAEIPREMVASGDWLTPRLNGIKYFEKPALQYWATAAAFEIFGVHEWSARLWTALTGFAGVVFAFFAGRRLFGGDAGLYAAIVLASGVYYFITAHFLSLDMAVTFFMSATVFAFLLAQRPAAAPREQRLWMWTAWASAALAVLTKGLIGAVLPGAALVVYSALQRDFSPWRRLYPVSGLAIFLLLAAPWFVAVTRANPEFFEFFFIHEHFTRFLTKVHGRAEPWWYFLPIILVAGMPWIAAVVGSLRASWRVEGSSGEAFRPRRFLLIYAAFIVFFFSLSGSKLPSYVLPAMPALALLAGDFLARGSRRDWTLNAGVALAISLVAVAVTPFLSQIGSRSMPAELFAAFSPWAVAGSVILAASAAAALALARRDRRRASALALGLGALLGFQVILTGTDALSPEKSGYDLVRAMRPYAGADTPIYSVAVYEQTVPFYLGRPVTLVRFREEFDFGLRQEPNDWIEDYAQFAAQWRKDARAVAIMPPALYDALKAQGLPMEVVAGNRRNVVVRKP
jgi:4-amino-4-deoxy-L-arabinose transferase-like glycosyltransferase